MCRSAQNDGCGAQTNPTPDLTLALTLTLTLTLTQPNPTLWGARGLLSRSAGAVLSLRANLKTLHVRAIKRLVQLRRSCLYYRLDFLRATICGYHIPGTNTPAVSVETSVENPKPHHHSGSCSWGTFRRLAHPWLELRSCSCARPRTLCHFSSAPALLLFALSPSLIVSFRLSNCAVIVQQLEHSCVPERRGISTLWRCTVAYLLVPTFRCSILPAQQLLYIHDNVRQPQR